MLGSVGFSLSYVLLASVKDYAFNRMAVKVHDGDTNPMTLDVSSILGLRPITTTNFVKASSPPAYPVTSTSVPVSVTPTSIPASPATSIPARISTVTVTSIPARIATVTVTSISISTTTAISTTTKSATRPITTSISIVTSVTSVIASEKKSVESPAAPEPSRDIESQESAKSKPVTTAESAKSKETLAFPVPSTYPAPRSPSILGYDWVLIHEHGQNQKHPFNLTSRSEFEDLQRTTSESLGLLRELDDIARAHSKYRTQAYALAEVLNFVALTPLQNMSRIVLELQDRFVEYNANKPHTASDSVQMGPFISDAVARLQRTAPGAEGLSGAGRAAYASMGDIAKADPKYCFNNNCQWRQRVLDRWAETNQKRDFFEARLVNANKELLARDEAKWETFKLAIKNMGFALPLYFGLLVLSMLCGRGWLIFRRGRPIPPARPGVVPPPPGAAVPFLPVAI